MKCIVLMLHQILQIFEETIDTKLLDILKKGLVLLHMIIMKEDPLVCVQNQVEYQFIRLIYGLEHVFKSQLHGNFSSESKFYIKYSETWITCSALYIKPSDLSLLGLYLFLPS